MKKRIVMALVLVTAFLLTGGMEPVFADGMSGVTGGVGLEPSNWGAYFRVWLEFDAHQLNPATGEADGMIKGRVYTPALGMKRLWFHVDCVSFGEENGKRTATLVARIERREGWNDVPGAGNPGEYLKWQVVDGGTPGSSGDIWRLQFYDYNNFVEYWPAYPDQGCSSFTADETNYLDSGNLVIH